MVIDVSILHLVAATHSSASSGDSLSHLILDTGHIGHVQCVNGFHVRWSPCETFTAHIYLSSVVPYDHYIAQLVNDVSDLTFSAEYQPNLLSSILDEDHKEHV